MALCGASDGGSGLGVLDALRGICLLFAEGRRLTAKVLQSYRSSHPSRVFDVLAKLPQKE
jgi:hypothetical protein